MEKLMHFESNDIQVTNIDGEWYFDLYAVGAALGQVKKNSKGVIYPAKDRIDKNCEKAEIKPCVRNVHKYITESQVYDLMLETRTDKCRAFRKWLTNEVLPELNHTGTYTIPKAEKPYEYFDKTWHSKTVLTLDDVEHLTGLKSYTVTAFLKKNGTSYWDYQVLEKNSMRLFKTENPEFSKMASKLWIITQEGFTLICNAHGIKIEEPKCFEQPKKSEQLTFEQVETPEPKSKEEKLLMFTSDIKNRLVTISVLMNKLVSLKNIDTNKPEIVQSSYKVLDEHYSPFICETLCCIAEETRSKIAELNEYI